jgi:hypothetical protein
MRRVLAVLVALTVAGCGGGPPRKPVPPSERGGGKEGALRREKFQVLGVGDEWHDGLTLIDGLERQGGVESVRRDERDGHFVVTYDPERTHRDELVRQIKELGRDVGESWEPIFEER